MKKEREVETIKSQLQGEKMRLENTLSELLQKQDEYEKRIHSLTNENLKLIEEIKEKNSSYQEFYQQFRDQSNKLGILRKVIKR